MTSKRQVTIPKEVADRYRIEAGDEIRWIPSGNEIRVVPARVSATSRLGIEERLALFDRATERREKRAASDQPAESPDRGWTREELYGRGRAR